MNIFIFPIADGAAKLSGRDYGVRDCTPRRDQLARSEDFREDFQGSSEKSHPMDETKDDAEARNDCSSIEGDFIHRHHVEPGVQLYVPKEETSPIQLTSFEPYLTISGTSIRIEVSQTHGQDSRSLHYGTNKFLQGMCGPEIDVARKPRGI